MAELLRVLIVEDSVDDTFFIVRELQRGGFEVRFERVETAGHMQAALRGGCWDLVISDYVMPQFSGDAALALFQESGLEIPFIMISGKMGEELAVEMVKAGAHDYVLKDHLSRLVPAVRRELHAAAERRRQRQTEALAHYLASLVENCDEAIIGKTLDGTVVSWNQAAERLYGYSAQEIIGRSISTLMPANRPEDFTELLAQLKRGEHAESLETVRMRKDGTTIEVSLTFSAIRDRDGHVIGASVVSRDITRQREQENERLALIQDLTAALEKAGSARGPLAA